MYERPIGFLGNRECMGMHSQGLPKFFAYPLLSQERVKPRTSNFVCTFIGSIEVKDGEKFWEK